MIVLTSVSEIKKTVMSGDLFCLTLSDCTGTEVVIQETITITKEIDYIASFRFALEDGTCPGFHLTGIFANKDELPIEIKNAILFDDLDIDQRRRFVNSLGISLEDNYAKKEDDLELLLDIEKPPTDHPYEDDHPKIKMIPKHGDEFCRGCGKFFLMYEGYITENNMPYHQECYSSAISNTRYCDACGITFEPDEAFITKGDFHFHTDCSENKLENLLIPTNNKDLTFFDELIKKIKEHFKAN